MCIPTLNKIARMILKKVSKNLSGWRKPQLLFDYSGDSGLRHTVQDSFVGDAKVVQLIHSGD